MKPKIKVGDVVRINNNGLQSCFGTTLGLGHMKTKDLRITWIAKESATYPEPTFDVEVDDPEITKFMITDRDFDLVR